LGILTPGRSQRRFFGLGGLADFIENMLEEAD